MTMKVINYMRWQYIVAILSVAMVVASLVSLGVKGLVLGLDFTGGTQIEMQFTENADLEKVRSQLHAAGFENAVAVHFGSEKDVLLKFKGDSLKGVETRVLEAMGSVAGTPVVKRVEFIGPQVGEELRDQALLGILVSLMGVAVYVSMRFQYKFALGAGLSLLHDVIITLGVFSFFELDFDLTVLAAVLAVIGYSINDTIIIFDRIRENFRMVRGASPVEVINESLTQVLLRTIYTTTTVLLVLFALYFFGGELLRNFSIALIVGCLVGTSSSIYVAASIILALKVSREDLVPTIKEGQVDEFDGLP